MLLIKLINQKNCLCLLQCYNVDLITKYDELILKSTFFSYYLYGYLTWYFSETILIDFFF